MTSAGSKRHTAHAALIILCYSFDRCKEKFCWNEKNKDPVSTIFVADHRRLLPATDIDSNPIMIETINAKGNRVCWCCWQEVVGMSSKYVNP